MALITKMHRCAFCGSSEVTVSENGTYTCRDCGKTADHGMRPPMWRLSTGFW